MMFSVMPSERYSASESLPALMNAHSEQGAMLTQVSSCTRPTSPSSLRLHASMVRECGQERETEVLSAPTRRFALIRTPFSPQARSSFDTQSRSMIGEPSSTARRSSKALIQSGWQRRILCRRPNTRGAHASRTPATSVISPRHLNHWLP